MSIKTICVRAVDPLKPFEGEQPHYITYDNSNVQVIPFQNGNGLPDLLIKPVRGSAWGQTLQEFTEPLLPLDMASSVSDAWLMSGQLFHFKEEYDGTFARSGDTGWNSGQYFPIARVQQGFLDSCRAIYVSTDAIYPDFIITEECVDSSTYTMLDPGNIARYSSYGLINNVRRFMSQSVLVEMLPQRYEDNKERDQKYCKHLKVHKEEYLRAYTSGAEDSCFISIFQVENCNFSYSDTVISTATREEANDLARYLLTQYSREFDELLRYIVKHCNVDIFINGCAIKYELKETSNGCEISYINGKRISNADLDEVIDHVTCYPERSEVYQSYVEQVSKISLKYHTRIKDGIKLVVTSVVAINNLLGEGVDLPKIGGSSEMRGANISNSRMVVNIRKPSSSKRAEVFLLGKWRSIINFDRFVSRATEIGWEQRNGNYCTNGTMHSIRDHDHMEKLKDKHGRYIMDAVHSISARLVLLDNFFHKDDRVFKDLYKDKADQEDRLSSAASLNISPRKLKKIIDICKDFASNFENSLSEEIERMKRSKAQLDTTVERIGAEVIENHSHHRCRVYRILGASGMRYDIREDTAAVYDSNTNGHICIVKAGDQLTYRYDYIISLLNSLSQDSYTARNIYTVSQLLSSYNKDVVEA